MCVAMKPIFCLPSWHILDKQIMKKFCYAYKIILNAMTTVVYVWQRMYEGYFRPKWAIYTQISKREMEGGRGRICFPTTSTLLFPTLSTLEERLYWPSSCSATGWNKLHIFNVQFSRAYGEFEGGVGMVMNFIKDTDTKYPWILSEGIMQMCPLLKHFNI